MKIDVHTPIARLTDTLPYLLDDKVGIIKKAIEHPVEADSPQFFRYICTGANTSAFNNYKNFNVGGGASVSREIALAKAIGETVERYCSAIYQIDDLPLTSYDQAPFDCVQPTEFTLYSDVQYAHESFVYKPFTAKSPIRWTPALDALTGDIVYVPASMVYMPYFFYKDRNEVPIGQPISTGLSCHCSYAEAAIGGLCEVVERDCFMITWQAKLTRPKIRTSSLSAENRDLVKRFELAGFDIHLMYISNETGIPAVLAVARHQLNYVPFVVSASASPSAEDAVRKALEELAHTERYAFQLKCEVAPVEATPGFDKVTQQADHVNFWNNPAYTKHAEFLYQSEEMIDFCDIIDLSEGDPVTQFQRIARHVHETGYRVLVCDLTTPEVKDIGLTVIRVLVPGYHPLFMGYNHRALGGKRLWTIPKQLGYQGISPADGDYPFPHPFP